MPMFFVATRRGVMAQSGHLITFADVFMGVGEIPIGYSLYAI
jgi:hypothetical protein